MKGMGARLCILGQAETTKRGFAAAPPSFWLPDWPAAYR
jgi:hypothetical protein